MTPARRQPKAASWPRATQRTFKAADEVHRKVDELHKGMDDVRRRVSATRRRLKAGGRKAKPSKVKSKPKKPPSRKSARRSDEPTATTDANIPIVGVGASAGGLQAMTEFLKELPRKTGMAFVLVQHLDPTHESALSTLLARVAKVEVSEAKNNEPLQADHLYIIPPNKAMIVSDRRLKLSPRRRDQSKHLPVDRFFHSMAQDAPGCIIGVVLSGTGSDGTQGLVAIKAAGGVTFVQDEESTSYPGMPSSAKSSECVDFQLPPADIAREIVRLGGQFCSGSNDPFGQAEETPEELNTFNEILSWLRQKTGVDFTHYKHATLQRRIKRRAMLHKCETLRDYHIYLRAHAAETKELFQDILIHVTGFFRDPAMFQTLKKKILPRLFKGKPAEQPFRIWTAGCSTGEEVYSFAITLAEWMSDKKKTHAVQIFGTDISMAALEKARAGLYPEAIKNEVSPDRLRRFFSKVEGGYRVNKRIREMCVFARHNVANDPPFSNLDLISCRNVLIYLGPVLQRRVLPVFHYALRSEGMLVLGAAESLSVFPDFFSLVDKKSKTYVKKAVTTQTAVSFSPARRDPVLHLEAGASAPELPAKPGSLYEVQRQADRIVLDSFSDPGVVINERMQVVQFRGRTGTFLEHSQGEASLNLLKMAREGLALDLKAAVAKAFKRNDRVHQGGLRVRLENGYFHCAIEVVPFSVPSVADKFALVLFDTSGSLAEQSESGGTARRGRPSKSRPAAGRVELENLRNELASARESLQSVVEEQNVTNEELRSANEEIVSSNEELQSTNEELETTKEELQSTNEELTTLNDELEGRNEDMERANNDLNNLLSSINIPVLMLASDLRIRRFTAVAEKTLNLIPSDVGRPITDLNLPVTIPDLGKRVIEVIDSLASEDYELRDEEGHWWSVRIRPYQTADRRIDGALLLFVDIHEMKCAMERNQQAREVAEAIVNTVREPLLVMDSALRVTAANRSFYAGFKVTPEVTVGRVLWKLGNGQWNIPILRELLEEILPNDKRFEDYEVRHVFPIIGEKHMILNGRQLNVTGEDEPMILLAIEEVRGG